MEYRKLGSTGLDISTLCFGAMSFGRPGPGTLPWALAEDESRMLVSRALAAGINFFDTANVYSAGTSEEVLGRALGDFATRDEVVIATKACLPTRPGPNGSGLSRKAIMVELDNSLRRLGVDYIDLYQIHRWDDATPIEETMSVLHDSVKSGKVRYLGGSTMMAWQFSKAQYVAERHGWTKFVSMQNQYNLLYREEEREMFPLCADQRVGILPWSPLARGRLTRDWDQTSLRGDTDERSRSLYQDSDREIVRRVAEVAAARGVSRAQIALAWVSRNPLVDAPIIGVTGQQHLDDAVASLEVALTDEEVATLESAYQPRHWVS